MSLKTICKLFSALIVATAFAATSVTVTSDAIAQGKPIFAGKKEEKGSRKDAAKAHAAEMGKKMKKGKDKMKKVKKDK